MALFHRRQKFWKEKWERGEATWHRSKVDARLKKYMSKLVGDKKNARILVTWCGKSVDIPWLCEKGFDVAGVELSQVAVKQMFEESCIPYSVTCHGDFLVFQATDMKLQVFVGNFYKLTPDVAGTFEAAWDHQALGASEPENRPAYKDVLVSLLKPGARLLLSNFEYGERKRSEPPFSISKEMLNELFKEQFDIEYLENAPEFIEEYKSFHSFDWVNHHIHILVLK